MKIIRRSSGLTEELGRLERSKPGARIGFVPTMGALHEGHAGLIRRAAVENAFVVVSIFVNPLQFSKDEDFRRYPKRMRADARLCRRCGADVLFVPDVRDLLGRPELRERVNVPALARGLCGRFRPGHFRGVVRIVDLLFRLVRPDRAYFGQKDYQQFRVVEAMTRRRFGGRIKCVLCPTVRSAGGLALSSRNAYLARAERREALRLYEALKLGRRLLRSGRGGPRETLRRVRGYLARSPALRTDYLEIVDSKNLKKTGRKLRAGPGRLLIAAAVRIGRTRLIDNVLV